MFMPQAEACTMKIDLQRECSEEIAKAPDKSEMPRAPWLFENSVSLYLRKKTTIICIDV